MKRSISVFLGTEQIGLIRYSVHGNRQSASFEYSNLWLANPKKYAIDPELPLVSGPQFHLRSSGQSLFHGAVSDTEPDGWGKKVILRDHAKRRKTLPGSEKPTILPLNELDFLLAVDDDSRVGALRFQDERGIFCRKSDSEKRTSPPLIELRKLLAASHAVETNTETSEDLRFLQGRGTSLDGLRPKCTIIDDQGRLAIGKFPSVSDDRSVTKGEVLALRLAERAGINAAKAEVVVSDGIPIALIHRFDRTNTGERIMYVSCATMLGASASDSKIHYYTDIVDTLRVVSQSAQADIEELWRRIAFSILITNVDDHLRNHGFLYVGNQQWRLSPAFDINPFPEKNREPKTWISEEAGPQASISGLMAVAPHFRISTKRAKAIITEVDTAVAGWRAQGTKLGMTKLELDAFHAAFEHEERIAAQKL